MDQLRADFQGESYFAHLATIFFIQKKKIYGIKFYFTIHQYLI